jgi:hypothetical protein
LLLFVELGTMQLKMTVYKVSVYEEGLECAYMETYTIVAENTDSAEELAYRKAVLDHPDGYNWRIHEIKEFQV